MGNSKKRSTGKEYEQRLKKAKAAWNNDRLNLGIKKSINFYMDEYRLNNRRKDNLLAYFNDEISLKECHSRMNDALKPYAKKQWERRQHEKKEAERAMRVKQIIDSCNEELRKENYVLIMLPSDKYIGFALTEIID